MGPGLAIKHILDNPSCHLLAPSPALPVNGEGVDRRPPPVYGGIEGGRLDAIPNFE
ncbi:hypothetical protein CCP3SC1_270010 [Gammaproteobacteria bacterium]